MGYQRGDIIEAKREWDQRSCTYVVWSSYDSKILTIQDVELDEEDVHACIGRLSEDTTFKEREEWVLGFLPEEFRDSLSAYAYRQGHSAGYDEVINILSEIVDVLRVPIKDFEQRMRNYNV